MTYTDMTVYHKTVRYQLHKIEVDAYRPTKKGINCTFGDYDFINNEVSVNYTCSDNPMIPPEERCTMKDIEDEIRRMEPRLVAYNHLDMKLPFNEGLKFILDHRALDGEYDHLRSKAIMQHPINLPKIEIKEINKKYDKPVLNESQKVFTVGEVIE